MFSRLAARFKRGTGVHGALLALGLVALLNGSLLGDVPTAAEADYGVPTVASVPRQTGIDSPGEQRLLDALLATEPYRNLTPEYKAWFTEEAVRALQQLPLKYRQALVQDARALVEMAQPGVPQQISYYLTFAAAAEVASETGWFEVRINPRGRIRVKVWQRLDEENWQFIESRVSQLLGTDDGLPEVLALAMGRKKSRQDCTSDSRYAEELGIDFPEY